MIVSWSLGAVVPSALLWQECGENPAIFCYRMGANL